MPPTDVYALHDAHAATGVPAKVARTGLESGFWAEHDVQRSLAELSAFAAERAPCRVLIIQKCVYDA